MGNRVITQRIKGITLHYAKRHMSEYKEGDFLRIVPEFDNPYDHNALAIYDDFNHKLGFIDKYTNVEIYRKIKDINYICYITNVHTDYSRPSIEFAIAYETDDSNEDIPGKLFYFYLSKYGQRNLSKAKGDNSNGYDGKQIARKNIGFYTSVTLNRHKAIMLAQSYIDNDDFDSAIDILMDFKNDNDAEVDTRLASAYFLRNDDAEDMKNAKFYFKKSFDEGRNDVIVSLGNVHFELEEYEEAFACYKKAAEQKMVSSYNNLACCYYNEIGTSKNLRLAFAYYKMAAENGEREAEYNLGYAYEFGAGTPVNIRKTFEWYKKSAEKDLVPAILKIGTFYYEGKYVYKDDDEALKWFQKVIELEPDNETAHRYIDDIHHEKHESY